jgi:uncharacterized circularly permuted ATP-grasp superfamily protein
METKRNKLLHNIKIWWISMLSPLKHVLEEYRPLLMKMTLDSIIVAQVATNLDQLCDVQVMF